VSEKQRIPDIDPENFGPQKVLAVNESYAGEYDHYHDFEAASWVKSQLSVDRMTELDAPDVIFEAARRRLGNDVLSAEAEEVFRKPGVSKSFNELISCEARRTGVYDELLQRLHKEVPQVWDDEALLKLVDNDTYVTALLGAIQGDVDMDDMNDLGVYDFARILADEQAPNNIKLELVRLHTDAMVYADKKLSQDLEALKVQFEQSLLRAVEAGLLPENAIPGVDEANRVTRLSKLSVAVSDPVLNSLNDRGGHYKPRTGDIYIDATVALQRDVELRSTFDHEMMHAYSGVSVRLDDRYPGFFPDDIDLMDADKDIEELQQESEAHGYGVTYVNVGRAGLQRSSAIINEAYTEWAAMTLRDEGYEHAELWSDYWSEINEVALMDKYGGCYLMERVMLAGLVAEYGVDILDIGEAYFESYEPKVDNPDRVAGKTLPANRKLDSLIAEKTPFKSLEQLTRFLVVEGNRRLEADEYVRKNIRALRIKQLRVMRDLQAARDYNEFMKWFDEK